MKIELIPQALEKAISLKQLGALNKAIEIYKEILQEDDRNIEACFELADCYMQIEDYNNALFYFKETIKKNKSCYLARFKMGKIYEKLCKYEFALFHLEKTICIQPDFYDALFSMAQCYRKMKDEKKMLEYLQKTLSIQPEHPSANHLLASLNNESCSEYSAQYTKDLFNRYAGHFEKHLVSSLNYKVPSIIKEKLRLLNLPKSTKVLDLGCGTGLLGKTIVELFPNLVGVDISSNMIDETRKKNIYSKLHIGDIHDFLLNNNEKFGLIIAADVFIYVGKLEEVFSYVKESLNSNGYFIFTIELLNQINTLDYQLDKSGRFSHRIEYIETLSNRFGFEIVNQEDIILREENKIGQEGTIFILKFD